ncbi:MAG TPA: hypothetical protein VGG72_19885 [Bryobacteraceae bacterium]|jgi:hypothetical protein
MSRTEDPPDQNGISSSVRRDLDAAASCGNRWRGDAEWLKRCPWG